MPGLRAVTWSDTHAGSIVCTLNHPHVHACSHCEKSSNPTLWWLSLSYNHTTLQPVICNLCKEVDLINYHCTSAHMHSPEKDQSYDYAMIYSVPCRGHIHSRKVRTNVTNGMIPCKRVLLEPNKSQQNNVITGRTWRNWWINNHLIILNPGHVPEDRKIHKKKDP